MVRASDGMRPIFFELAGKQDKQKCPPAVAGGHSLTLVRTAHLRMAPQDWPPLLALPPRRG